MVRDNIITSSSFTYEDIIRYLIENGNFRNQFLIYKAPPKLIFQGNLEMNRTEKIEKYININIERKLNYIKKTYYNNNIIKSNPCITKIKENRIYFRAARLFPTLYLDLIIIKQKFENTPIILFFDKLFIGYHILGLSKFNSYISENYSRCLNHWEKRTKNSNNKLLASINKYSDFIKNL